MDLSPLGVQNIKFVTKCIAHKIQYLYPIIEDVKCSYIPSPYLVANAVTASMLNRLTLGKNDLRRKLGKEVIEEYLFSIYREVDRVFEMLREAGMDANPEICDYIHSHIKVIPLYQIEQTVLIGHSYMECLLKQVAKRDMPFCFYPLVYHASLIYAISYKVKKASGSPVRCLSIQFYGVVAFNRPNQEMQG